MAGSHVACSCGAKVRVPPLSALRKNAGREAYETNSLDRVQRAIAEGDLPSDRCIECKTRTPRVLGIEVVCERSYMRTRDTTDRGDFLTEMGSLLSPIWVWRKTVVVERLGRDRKIEIPIRVCESCVGRSSGWFARRHWRKLLSRHPICGELFREFPKASLRLAWSVDEG